MLVSSSEGISLQSRQFKCIGNGTWVETGLTSSLSRSPVKFLPACATYLSPPVHVRLAANFTSAEAGFNGSCTDGFAFSFRNRIESALSDFCQRQLGSIAKFTVKSVVVRVDKWNSNRLAISANVTIISVTSQLENTLATCVGDFAKLTRSAGSFLLENSFASTPNCPPLEPIVIGSRDPGNGAPLKIPQIQIEVAVDPCPPGHIRSWSLAENFGLNQAETEKFSCLRCPKGTFADGKNCQNCPIGTFQSSEGAQTCQKCPNGTSTSRERVESESACWPLCPRGHFSHTGVEPCNSCSTGTYQPVSGQTFCIRCPSGLLTSQPGADRMELCRKPCRPGEQSWDGLEPCQKCPKNFYQPSGQSTSCAICPGDLVTLQAGATSLTNCTSMPNCTDDYCKNGGTCLVLFPGDSRQVGEVIFRPQKSKPEKYCLCTPYFNGPECSKPISLCHKLPGFASICLNDGLCIDTAPGRFTCQCPLGLEGKYCERRLNPCASSPCHNGTCHSRPDGTFFCRCHSGYTGLR